MQRNAPEVARLVSKSLRRLQKEKGDKVQQLPPGRPQQNTLPTASPAKAMPKSDHVDWNVVTPIVRSKPRGKKYAADLIDWSA